MLELDFKELQTFKIPEGDEYIINPLNVEDVKVLFQFMEYEDELKTLHKKKDKKKAHKLIYGSEDQKQKPMIELANIIVSKSIRRVDDGEPLPEKYRTVKKLIQLCGHVAMATMDLNESDLSQAGDIPLEVKKMLSDASGGTSTPSKKKGGRKKNS